MKTAKIFVSAPWRKPSPTYHDEKGFTIIEALLVLAIAALILAVIFIAIPIVQRAQRNQQRRSDASMLLAAISECLANKQNQRDSCNEPGELPLDIARFGVYYGVHYGATTATPPVSVPPTFDEPNWLFNTTCNLSGDLSIPASNSARQFSVSFLLESPNTTHPPPFDIYNGWIGRCISGWVSRF